MIYNPTCIVVVVVGWWLVVCNQWYICICVHQLKPASGVHMNSASDFSCKKKIVLVIFSYIFWQIVVLQGLTNGNVTSSTNVNFFQFDKWQHTQYDRCKSYQIVCTWLHTGHPKQLFALKGWTNPALLSLCIWVFYLKRLRSKAAQILLGPFSLGFLGKLSICIRMF